MMKTPDPAEALRLLASRRPRSCEENEDVALSSSSTTTSLGSTTQKNEAEAVVVVVVHWEEELSEELWYQVLSFVEPIQLMKSVAGVSKFLHDNILNTKQFWLHYLESLRCSPKSSVSSKDDWLQMGNNNNRSNNNNSVMAAAANQQEVTENQDQDELFIRYELNRHQLQRLCLFCVATTNNSNHQTTTSVVPPAGLHYGSRLVSRTRAENIRNRNFTTITTTSNNNNNSAANTTTTVQLHMERRRVCLASSTEHANELLENVLQSPEEDDDDGQDIFRTLGILAALRHQQQQNLHPAQLLTRPTHYWWSSRPSPTHTSEETLLFTTNCPLAALHQLKWKPLLDPFTRGQVYSWSSAIVKAYRLPLWKLDSKPNALNAGFPCSIAIFKETTTTRTTTTTNSAAVAATAQQQRQRRAQRQRQMQVDLDNDAEDDEDSDDSSEDDDDDDDDDDDVVDTTRQEGDALTNILKDEIPVYVSPPLHYNINLPAGSSRRFTHQQQVPWQQIVFPTTSTKPIIANVVTLTLVGKNSRQFAHSGFYACVEQVQLNGIPLLRDANNQRIYHLNCISGL